MAKRKVEMKYLTQYEEDCVYMSYRYCIGRHTIASQYHAENIAKNAYGRMTPERTRFMSEDINNEIYSQLNWGNFINMGWYGDIPKSHFKPLDVLYFILDKESINTIEKIAEIKEIRIVWNRDKNDFDYSIYYFHDNDKDKAWGRSFWDITDLEVWQQLANLFDLNSYNLAKVRVGDGEQVTCYYECWHAVVNQGKITYQKRKHDINSPFNWAINEECIVEDNINELEDLWL